MQTVQETAILLAAILNRSEQTRARVSTNTIKTLGGRALLRSVFVQDLIDAVGDYGWVLCELRTGGYGAVKASALEAARSVTAKRILSDQERAALHRGRLNWRDLTEEAAAELLEDLDQRDE